MPAAMKAIDEMDISEKVQTMDYLWASLEASSGEYMPPAFRTMTPRRGMRLAGCEYYSKKTAV